MKKYILFILLAMSLMIVGCNSGEETDGDVHMNVATGKVKNVVDKNNVLIEITEERGGFQIGDELQVEYKKIEIDCDDADDKDSYKSYSVQEDDIVSVQFWEKDLKKKDQLNSLATDVLYVQK